MKINGRPIGPEHSPYVIAEISANHNQSLDRALELVRIAKQVGADAVKLQTYTPDTLTIDSQRDYFQISGGTPWDGKTLYELYAEAHMPWEWHEPIFAEARRLEIDVFSTAYDASAVDFLAALDIPAFKIASFENVDVALIRKASATGKPLIISTGMATLAEIQAAVAAARQGGASSVALLKCTSAYPAPPEEMNLHTIPHMAKAFGVPVGLSDHTLGIAVPVAALALGACIIEKHITMSRQEPGPDSAFSLEPAEFEAMVEAVGTAHSALGEVHYRAGTSEQGSVTFRRSLFVTRAVRAGEQFTADNVRSIRPGHGLSPAFLDVVIGRRAGRDIEAGTPFDWDLLWPESE